MIHVVTGHSGPGGSTVALNNLVNLFNANDMPSVLVTHPKRWEGINCKVTDSFVPLSGDYLIYHFFTFEDKNILKYCKKVILSCHETNLFPIKQINTCYHNIHYVSQFQKDWQGVNGVIIPNIIRKFSKRTNNNKYKVAAVIGSIDPNKRTHLSIQKAINDGFSDIRLYGGITDLAYFKEYVEPLLSDNVKLCGIATNMDYVYNQITHVYHSPIQETFNLIKAECNSAGVKYVGEEGNDTKAEYWEDKDILKAWKKLLSF